MNRPRGIAASVVALMLASLMAVPTPVSAANNSGTNWPTPESLGLICDGGRWGHIGSKLSFGPVRDAEYDVARQHWTCSSWTVTMTVARYPDEAAARIGQQWARDNHIRAYGRGDHLCQTSVMFNDGAELCATIPTTATGGQIHREGKRDGALEVSAQSGGSSTMWAGSIGAWERRGTYVASIDSWSGAWGGWGYFSADQLAAAAAALAANPPQDLPFNTINPLYDPTTSTGSATRKTTARDVADAMRAWSRSTNRRYKTLTPRKKTLVRYGSSAPAARAARFAGFTSSTAKRVWIKVGATCLRANANSSGKWRSASCPTTARWNKAR